MDDKNDPGQTEIRKPRTPDDLYRLQKERKNQDSILEDSVR